MQTLQEMLDRLTVLWNEFEDMTDPTKPETVTRWNEEFQQLAQAAYAHPDYPDGYALVYEDGRYIIP